MNYKNKYIRNCVISLIVTFFIVIFLRGCLYSHKSENNPQRYLWIFNDSVKNEVNNHYSTGDIRDNDIHYYYKYHNTFITIFEFKELSFIKLNEVPFKLNADFSKFENNFIGETFNVNLHTLPEISVYFKLPFNNSFCINLDNKSRIDKVIEGKNYRGFFGDISKMSFSNAQGDNLVLFNYKRKITSTLLLIYKHEGRFIVILINSENKFNDSVINILNLKERDASDLIK